MAADTFIGILREHAARQPGQLACAFLSDGEEISAELTYGQLDERARRVADVIGRRLAPGARALIVCEPGLGFIESFLGCMYAGVAPVPVSPPSPPRFETGVARVRAVLANCSAEAVITTAMLRPLLADLTGTIPAILPEETATGDPGAWRDPGIRPTSVAFLQYTSGSTSSPRGVVLTHKNLLANQRAIEWSLDIPPASRWVTWLPLYHDMGLIGTVLHPLYGGGTIYVMSPLHFMQKPARWPRAISRFRARVSGGPNFAYELAARRAAAGDLADLDLSCWRVAFCGAEPIRAETMTRFGAVFSQAGLDPACLVGCYGLAESTLLVSGARRTDPKILRVSRPALETCRAEPADGSRGTACPAGTAAGATENTATVVSCGRIFAEYDVRIADPVSCAPLPDGQVGEIWVAGPSVAKGYWRRAEDTARTFQAILAGDGHLTYLRTGDLGFLRGGQLYVTGRIKDLLIVRGRNVYPHDVEYAAHDAHPLARRGGAAAFTLEAEQVAVVQETTAAPPQLPEVAAAVRRSVLEREGVVLAVVYLVPAREVPKTSSGKVRRRDCRTALLRGELTVLHSDLERGQAAPALRRTGVRDPRHE
jgi:acyl-CoA synthetase (AMP-forming)/AMP-acid ligase II